MIRTGPVHPSSKISSVSPSHRSVVGVGHARTVHAAAEIDAAEVGIGVLEFVFQFEPGVVDHLVGDAAGQSERFGSPDQGGGQQKEKQQTFHGVRN